MEKHGEELYPRLAAAGVKVRVFSRSPYFSRDRRLAEWKGVFFTYLWAPRNKHLEALLHSLSAAVYVAFHRRQTDVVHVHNIGPALCMPLLKLAGVRTVLTYHSANYEHKKWGPVSRCVLRLGERIGLRCSDSVITVTAASRRRLEKRYPGVVVAHITNGVSPMPRVPAGETLRRWGLLPRKYFFTACRFVDGKGLEDLITAFGRIPREGLSLVIAGGADHETAYSRKIKALAESTPGVVLAGVLTGLPLHELYANAGLFVLPSYSEGLPLAVLEAMSCGTPVLASDIEANREVGLREYRYYPVGSVDQLTERMSQLISAGLSPEEGEVYARMIVDRFNWDDIARRTHQVLLDAVHNSVP